MYLHRPYCCTAHTTISSVLETICLKAVTMKVDMTKADISGKELGASGAIIVATFLPKCQ